MIKTLQASVNAWKVNMIHLPELIKVIYQSCWCINWLLENCLLKQFQYPRVKLNNISWQNKNWKLVYSRNSVNLSLVVNHHLNKLVLFTWFMNIVVDCSLSQFWSNWVVLRRVVVGWVGGGGCTLPRLTLCWCTHWYMRDDRSGVSVVSLCSRVTVGHTVLCLTLHSSYQL